MWQISALQGTREWNNEREKQRLPCWWDLGVGDQSIVYTMPSLIALLSGQGGIGMFEVPLI